MPRVSEILVRELFRAIEDGETGESLRRFYAPDARQVEHPSLFRPEGGTRDLDAILAGSELGARAIGEQRFDDLVVVDDGVRLAVRFVWRATTLAELGPIPAGVGLRADVAAFFQFRDGRILRQESFDCYTRTW